MLLFNGNMHIVGQAILQFQMYSCDIQTAFNQVQTLTRPDNARTVTNLKQLAVFSCRQVSKFVFAMWLLSSPSFVLIEIMFTGKNFGQITVDLFWVSLKNNKYLDASC